jgi:hypothetical protein
MNRWAQDGCQHDADAPDRHRLAPLCRGKCVDHHCLRQGDARCPGHALQKPEEHDLVDGHGESARRGGDHEARDAGEHDISPPEAVGQVPSERNRHGLGHDIGG